MEKNKKNYHNKENKTVNENIQKMAKLEEEKKSNEAKERQNEERRKRINTKIFIYILIFSFSLIACVYLTTHAFEHRKPKIINYKENQNIDYKVYLKENDFYEQEYLEKDMIYIASLIDKITLDFNYDFNIEEKTNVAFNYKIKGDLIIANPNGNMNYLKKEYTLLDNKTFDMKNQKEHQIHESIDLDYDYYNTLASNFKTSYGVETNSYLRVYLEVSKSSNDKNGVDINDIHESYITIPLSQRSVEIAFTSDDTSVNKKAIADEEIIFHSKIFMIELIFIFVLIISLINIIRLWRLLQKKKSAYDKYIEKILREYDRLIIETPTETDFSKYNIIKIKKFAELLDVRDNLKLPIIYHNIKDHQKCYFYIKKNKDIYLMDVKDYEIEG